MDKQETRDAILDKISSIKSVEGGFRINSHFDKKLTMEEVESIKGFLGGDTVELKGVRGSKYKLYVFLDDDR